MEKAKNMTTLYIDTNILIYGVEESRNLYGKDLSNSATRLFAEVIGCKYRIILSSWTMTELLNKRRLEDSKMLFTLLQKKIIKVFHTEEELLKAKENNPSHFQDELHGMLALRANADYIVTRNVDDFINFIDRIKVVKPEHLL
ncbi:MAG: hypothetical protein ABIF10_01705 [Candidatus Woesearchaeota archaeon]